VNKISIYVSVVLIKVAPSYHVQYVEVVTSCYVVYVKVATSDVQYFKVAISCQA